MNPDNVEIKVVLYSNRAQCLINLKRYREALQDAQSALELDPSHVKSILRRGRASYSLKLYKKAKRDFNRVVKEEPQNKTALEFLAKADQKMMMMKLEAYQSLLEYAEIEEGPDRDQAVTLKPEEYNLDENAPPVFIPPERDEEEKEAPHGETVIP